MPMSRKDQTLWTLWLVSMPLCVAVSIFSPHPAFAGILTTVQTSFLAGVAPMYATAATWSQAIFYGIAGIEFLWVLAEGVLFQSSLEGWINTFGFRLVLFGCGWWLVTNQVMVAQGMLGEINTIAGAFAPGGGPLTGDSIAHIGFNDALQISLANVWDWNPAVSTASTLAQWATALFIQLGFLVVGCELVIITVGTQFCIALGSVLLGFSGTRWTRGIASVWPRMLVMTFLLSIAVSSVVGIGNAISADILTHVANIAASNGGGVIYGLSTIGAEGFLYMMIAFGLPSLTAWAGAHIPMSAGGAIRTAAMTAASYVGGRFGGANAAGSGAAAKANVANLEAATRTD